jgi:hypothetical protein
VDILVSCREHKSCSSLPRKLLQSPVTSSLLGPISSPHLIHKQPHPTFFL